jgi:two-component system response regulator AtoC
MRDKIIVIDDEPNIRKILVALLSREGYEVFSFDGFKSAIETLNTEDVSVVITDLSMPEHSGLDVLKYCKEYTPDLPVILITAFGTIEAAVTALKNGAFDFVLKPFDLGELSRILQKAIQTRKRRKREPALELMNAQGVGPVPVPLFGSESSTVQLREQVERVSGLRSHAFMFGEVGSGKRSIAYEVHRKSDRARFPFIQVHCDAIPTVFQVGELFGLEKGSMPMNFFSKPGSFELGLGGTILLDEIDALGVEAQNTLFTALENEFFTRVHGAKKFPADFRIIATSSKDLSQKVIDGTFHVELFARLSLEKIILKPLRERKKDIQTDLLPYFLDRACRKRGIPTVHCEPDVEAWFTDQEWRGNIGELERVVEQVMNYWSKGPITLSVLSLAGLR